MPYETIRVASTVPFATVTLNRPEALNAITVGMLDELRLASTQLAADRSARVVVLTGEGRAFSAAWIPRRCRSFAYRGAVGDLLDVPGVRSST